MLNDSYPNMDWRDQTDQNLILLDEEFLATLSEQKDRQIYARIIALDINENPIDRIEGRVTGGSINVDGNSTVRRTCSLTLVCDQIDINDFYWGIKTKFRLFIGLQNNLAGDYAHTEKGKFPKIVWFPQGTYVVGSFNTSIATNNCTISISGKDKMSLLNGDLGGSLFASIDFGTEEVQTKTMEPVGTIDDISSDTLMAKEYYFKQNPDGDIPAIVLASDEKYVFVLNEADGYYAKDGNLYRYMVPQYNYRQCTNNDNFNENVIYYTYEDDEYVPVEEPQSENITSYYVRYSRKPDGFKHYDMYQQVIEPQDLFVSVDTSSNQSLNFATEKLFYQKAYQTGGNETQYYVAAKSEQGEGTAYFKLKELFTLGYEKTITHLPIETIIRRAVHEYAKEPFHNIVINDLEDYGLEQLTYRGDKVLFAIRNIKTNLFVNLMFADAFEQAYVGTSEGKLPWTITYNADKTDIESITMRENENEVQIFHFDTLASEYTDSNGTILQLENHQYKIPEQTPDINTSGEFRTIAKITYGMDLGYRLTDLTYPGDLICSIGENLTSILDKIKNMLGDFEYFYDLDGRFVFQRKKIYVNTSWSQLTNNEDESYVSYGNDKKKFSFNFEGNRLISAFQNSPVLNNLRNDFVVWGKRKGVSGADIPIHARYAIDKKPVFYRALSNEIYTTDIKYAQEQIIDFQPKTTTSISEEISNRLEALQNFTFQYPINSDLHLAAPVRKGLYGWEPGWWDIRDWARYYKIVTTGREDGEDPNGTMKFYSSNDAYGCISVSKLLADGVPLNLNAAYRNAQLWLLEEFSSGNLNYGHGFGMYKDDITKICTYYTSSLASDNRVITTPTEQTENFHYPYASCDDRHTYLYFLNEINQGRDRGVYFYNPNFPFGETETELITETVIEERESDLKQYHIHIVDWREIIYQMALDFFAGQGCSTSNPIYTWIPNDAEVRSPEICCTDPDHFLYEVGIRNPYYYPTGYTGYEQYYTDLQGFWRQLYNPDYTPICVYTKGEYVTKKRQVENTGYWIKEKEWKDRIITDLIMDYYVDCRDEHIQHFQDVTPELFTAVSGEEGQVESEQEKKRKALLIEYYKYAITGRDFVTEDLYSRKYWNKAVFESPESLNFWFDFLDSDTELASFSIKQVGDRTKVVNDDKAGAIFYREIPGLIVYDLNQTTSSGAIDYTTLRQDITENSGYTFVYIPKGFSQYLTISYRGTSVKNKIDELIYQFAYCIENVSITAIPVYHLQPNTRIYVQDKNTGVEGEYIVSKITIPLTYNGTMSISAAKAPERLY